MSRYMRRIRDARLQVVPVSVLVLAVGGCGGDYGGGPVGGDGSGGSGGGGARAASMEELFSDQVQPRIDFCRSCHVPGAAADVEDGDDFVLSKQPGEDLDNLRASWERLGAVNPSRILLMASGQEASHSGGTPWAQGSEAYEAMSVLLRCFEDPEGCDDLLADMGGGSGPVEELPLLGSRHGGHAWFDFCEGKEDSAELPPDPRSLVQPGVSEGKAVHFNAYWTDCHAYPERVGERPHPETCGELRASYESGARLMEGNGAHGAGTFFNGDAVGSALEIDAEQYNRLWRQWQGVSERPENFDHLVAQRYGQPLSDERNPYPLPGEDPNAEDGGSGQLPAMLTQFREADGTWTGKLGFTCHSCHSGKAGDPEVDGGPGFVYGMGNSEGDIALMAREIGIASRSPGIIFSLFGTSRGTNNASAVNVFFLLNQENGLRLDRYILDVITSGSTASGDTPAWWNLGSRPLKFQDGYFAADSARVDVIFYTPLDGVLGGDDGENWVREHAQDADKWAISLKSPEYPLDVDEDLAKQGAILFHNKDLWADKLDNPVPRPDGGNGSCASCHGAYSPRFVNDSSYLADPSMEGVASYVAPMDIIGTDPERLETNNEGVAQFGTTSFLGYPETIGTDEDCGPQSRSEIRGDRERGYLAPPLYGIWATAPYFHNGAVPDVWGVLDPEERPDLWRRVSTPAPSDQAGDVVMGYDTNLDRAYDEQRMGWDYDVIECGDAGTTPLLSCSPNGSKPAIQRILDLLYGNVIAAWNLGNLPIFFQLGNQQIENRKVYNTHLFSQGNQGHEFTRVLTDQERRALLEYMKTL